MEAKTTNGLHNLVCTTSLHVAKASKVYLTQINITYLISHISCHILGFHPGYHQTGVLGFVNNGRENQQREKQPKGSDRMPDLLHSMLGFIPQCRAPRIYGVF